MAINNQTGWVYQSSLTPTSHDSHQAGHNLRWWLFPVTKNKDNQFMINNADAKRLLQTHDRHWQPQSSPKLPYVFTRKKHLFWKKGRPKPSPRPPRLVLQVPTWSGPWLKLFGAQWRSSQGPKLPMVILQGTATAIDNSPLYRLAWQCCKSNIVVQYGTVWYTTSQNSSKF
jgi:hypothetical protein